MDNLIPVINKLHDVFGSIEKEIIKLPQIVVIGSQSAGKSSVLENIVGQDFLPRGQGIVTRCPIILQLIYTPILNINTPSTYGKFLHTKDQVFVDFSDIRKEIERKTDEIAGSGKCVVDDPINLKIFSPKVLNLTLVDLPGITKLPVQDQPEDIEDRIRNLCIKYGKQQNSIILSVSSANNDLANSESLKLAMSLDPEGIRTFCILTKLDLMDDGTDAKDILTGNTNIKNFRLGVIGVVNRSQADINSNKAISDALESEALFFKKHYPSLAYQNGTPYLAKRLNELLMKHIKSSLPNLKTEINIKIKQCTFELQAYGNEVKNKKELLMEIITHFNTSYCNAIDGNSRNINTSELCGGARIGYIFYSMFHKTIDEIDSLGNLSPKAILTAIQNASGPRSSLFVPELTFELLVKNQISRLEEPSLICIDLVLDEMQRIIQNCGTHSEMDRFPKLSERIINVVTNLLRQRHEPTNEMVSNLVKIELAFINNRHPDFDTSGAYGKSMDYPMKHTMKKSSGMENHEDDNTRRYENMNEKDMRDCKLIENLIKSYFDLVRKSVKDLVPKTIMCFLVNYIKENLQGKLVLEVLHESDINELLEENIDFANRRKELKDLLENLRKANCIISEIRETQLR